MHPLEVAGVAVALGCDAFAVSLSVATRGITRRGTFRMSFHFGLFQFLMPLIGWYASRSVSALLESAAGWLAFGILLFVSLHMFKEALNEEEEKDGEGKTRGWSLIFLSLATSQDALGVGLGMGLLNLSLLYKALVIGVTASAMSFVAVYLGKFLSTKFGKKVEILGAFILLYIAFSLLLKTV